MKNNILILIADFYPNPSPNTTCFMPFINELAKYHNVDVVTSDTGKMENKFDNIVLHRIEDKKMINHFKWLQRIENQDNKVIKRIIRYCSYVSKFIYSKIYNDGTPEKGYIGWNKSKVIEEIEHIISNKRIDYVISISHPFKTHDIIYEIKKKYDFKWYMLEFDAYGINNFLFKDDDKEERIMKEKMYFETADKIILTPQLYKSYNNNDYSIYSEKFYSMEFCNLYKPIISDDAVDLNSSNKKNLFYAGAFNLYIRNPKKVFDFLAMSNIDFIFNVVTKCDLSYAQKEIDKLGERCKVMPRQRFDDVYLSECKADFNISIGNTIDYQSPGKTLELMSAGRPIIHFAFISTDPVLDYLENYPNSLVIKLYEDVSEQVNSFEEFISKSYETVDIEDVIKSNKEYEPQYIKDRFVELFYEVI